MRSGRRGNRPFTNSDLANIAYRYYVSDEKQKTIASDFSTTQSEISRQLKRAKDLGVVKIQITTEHADEMARQVKKKYGHLREVLVTPFAGSEDAKSDDLLKAVGLLCAKYLLDSFKDRTKIGLSCGNSVNAVIEGIGELKNQGHTLPGSCYVVPLLTLMMPEVVAITPPALVANLIRWLPDAKGKAFQLPPVEKNKADLSAYSYARNPEIIKLLKEIEHLNVYLVGIGYIDYEGRMRVKGKNQPLLTHEFNSLMWKLKLAGTLKKMGAVGESVYQPFDANGNVLATANELLPLRESMFNLSLEVLRHHVERNTADVIAIVAGKMKHEAAYGAVRSKAFNVLVTDIATCEHILRK